MKTALINFIKYQRWAYVCYFYMCSIFIKLLRIFVRPDDKLIMFSSFGGMKYDDSPKAIYEAMIANEHFKNYRFVWAFHNPGKFEVEGADVIKTDTLKYFVTALKARVWITNSSIERGLNFKGKSTLCINTWHGTPIKKMGEDINAASELFVPVKKMSVDFLNVQGDFEAEIFSRIFDIPSECMLKVGLPRNDRLAKYETSEVTEIRKKLNIPVDKKVILYAPTFREYERNGTNECVLNIPMNIAGWKEKLSDKYFILFRAHYEVTKAMNIKNDDFICDVSQYPVLDDLMIASDILISDYSSIFFDFSIMDKMMFHFTYDYAQYENVRGMYFDVREYLSGSGNEDGLLKLLVDLDEKCEKEKNVKFRNRYINYFGNAAEKTVERIDEEINQKVF